MVSNVLDVATLGELVQEVSPDCFVNSLIGSDDFLGMEKAEDGIIVSDVFEQGDSVRFRLVDSPVSSGRHEFVFTVDGFDGFWSLKAERVSDSEILYGTVVRQVEKNTELVDVWVPVQ